MNDWKRFRVEAHIKIMYSFVNNHLAGAQKLHINYFFLHVAGK